MPSKDELVALCGILTTTFSMEQNATTMSTYLKMPMAGYRRYSNSGILGIGTAGYYWSSIPYDVDCAYTLHFGQTSISTQSKLQRATGFPVRCFKDVPTIPTSSWTTLYD